MDRPEMTTTSKDRRMPLHTRWIEALGKNFHYRTLLICCLSLFFIGLLPTLITRAIGWDNGIWLIGSMWRGEGGGDSWGAIGYALHHLDTRGVDEFYETLYYKAGHQFIYSPLSLIFFRLTQFPPMIDWYSATRMNSVSWWVMLAMILVMTLIVRQSSVKFGPSNTAPNLVQTIGMAILSAIAISTFFPILGGFRNGQIQTWLDFLAMLSLLLVILERRILAGASIGLACIIKPQLAILFLWAAARRDWWFLIGGLLVVGAFGTASLIAYGWRIHLDYASLLLFLSRRGESYVGNQSINGLLNRMFFLGPNVVFEPTHTQIIYNVWVHAATTISSAIMILGAIFIKSPRDTFAGVLDFCTVILVATLASPVAYTHHYGLVLPIFWLALLKLRSDEKNQVVLYCLLGLSFGLLANYFQILSAVADSHWNFLQSLPMFSAFILLGLLLRLRLSRPESVPIAAPGFA
jgi:alpha-1,2-mannosyltransferase